MTHRSLNLRAFLEDFSKVRARRHGGHWDNRDPRLFTGFTSHPQVFCRHSGCCCQDPVIYLHQASQLHGELPVCRELPALSRVITIVHQCARLFAGYFALVGPCTASVECRVTSVHFIILWAVIYCYNFTFQMTAGHV